MFATAGPEQGPCVSGAVADTGSGTRAQSSLSFLSIAQEGKGLAHCVCASQCPSSGFIAGMYVFACGFVVVCRLGSAGSTWPQSPVTISRPQ